MIAAAGDKVPSGCAGVLLLPESASYDIVDQIEAAIARLDTVRNEIGRVIFGQERVVDETLITLLCGGHVLLVGVPGLAKTRLAATLGIVLGMSQKRVQFTPDLMPADILGSEVLDEGPGGRQAFRFIAGPIFAQLLMADEINRASPRTQAALLQAMQERRVTVAGQDHALPQPFHVLATQNPIEQEGTYPLPEAQLDRFLMQVDVEYPSPEAERRMMIATTTGREEQLSAVLDAAALMQMQELVRRVPVGEQTVDLILRLVRAGRPENAALEGIDRLVAWGPGPRASQALMLAVRARAMLDRRLAPAIEDVLTLAPPVLRHRMALTFAARAEGVTVDDVIGRLVRHVA
jgi:MoxR-like ATPase